jgi:hypothetical protein
MCFNPSPERRVPSPNRYMALAKFCFCKNNKRTIIITSQEIYHKLSPPRGWDGCTFGAYLRVCDLWVRSRSLAANHARGPGYILLPT